MDWNLIVGIATVLGAIIALASLFFIAYQARSIKNSIAYSMVLRAGDPNIEKHIFDAVAVLTDKQLSAQQKKTLLNNRQDPFRFNLRILGAFMETMATAYKRRDIDRNLIYEIFYARVIEYFDELKQSEILDDIRTKWPGAYKMWGDLTNEFRKKGPPH